MDADVSVKKSTSSALTEDDQKFVNHLNAYAQTKNKCYDEITRHTREYFGNDPEELSNKSSKKNKSLRKIIKLVDGISVTEIHRIAQVAFQDDFLKEKGVDVNSASFSLRAELVSLPNNEEKITLIKQAMEEGWSVRKLRDAVKEKKGGTKKAREATAKHTTIDFSRLSKDLCNLTDYLNPLQQNLETMERNQVETLRDETLRGQSLLKDLEADYQTLIDAIDRRLRALDGVG